VTHEAAENKQKDLFIAAGRYRKMSEPLQPEGGPKHDNKIADELRQWGFDVETFRTRAKKSMEGARGDASEVGDALRAAAAKTRQVLADLQKSGGPAAAELKGGFEQAWEAIEQAFIRASRKVRARGDAEPRPPDDVHLDE
jgi:hypothetical protein